MSGMTLEASDKADRVALVALARRYSDLIGETKYTAPLTPLSSSPTPSSSFRKGGCAG